MTDDAQTGLPETAAPETTTPAPVEPTPESTAPQADAPTEGQTEDPAASDDTGDDAADGTAPKKKTGGFQKRIDTLTREKYEAELRNRQLEAELQQFRKTSSQDDTADPGDEPNLTDFQTVDEYRKALTDWGIKKGRFEAHQHLQQREAAQRELTAIAQLEVREDKARAKYGDYDRVVDPISTAILGHPTLKEFIVDSETGPDLLYHLGKNPAVLLDLSRLSPIAAVRELTRLEARLTAPPPPKPVTTAPEPIKPVGARETVAKTLADLAEADKPDAYIARRRKQMAGG